MVHTPRQYFCEHLPAPSILKEICNIYLTYIPDRASVLKTKWNIFEYFDPVNICLDNENKQFSGWPNLYFD